MRAKGGETNHIGDRRAHLARLEKLDGIGAATACAIATM